MEDLLAAIHKYPSEAILVGIIVVLFAWGFRLFTIKIKTMMVMLLASAEI